MRSISASLRLRPSMAPRTAVDRLHAVRRHFMTSDASPSSPDGSAPKPPQPFVLTESNRAYRRYILNRPDKLNTLNVDTVATLRKYIQDWSQSNLCQIVVGTGAGPAFCAGGDVKQVLELASDPSTVKQASRFFRKEFELDYLLACLNKPYVAIMDGVTMGGGVGLSMPAHFRVATEKTVFAMPETKIGFFPDVGASYFLPRLDGEVGTYLALTGNSISGREVFELGLATHFIPSSRVPLLLESLAALENLDAAERSIDAAEETENDEFSADLVDDQEGGPDAVTLNRVNSAIEELSSERDEHDPPLSLSGPVRSALDWAFRHDTVEDIVTDLTEFSNHQNPTVAKWAQDTLKALAERSATSLKIALLSLRHGRDLSSLREAFRMELNISHAFCNGVFPDFTIGVDHVLVKKLKTPPVWSTATLQEVSLNELRQKLFSSKKLGNTPPLDVPAAAECDPSMFALPKESDIGLIIRGEHESSGGTALTAAELLDKCLSIWPKHGVREKVHEIVGRKCVVDTSTDIHTLKWVH